MTDYNKILEEIYFNKSSPYGFSSKKNLLEGAQKKNKNITSKIVEDFFASYVVPGRFRTGSKTFPRRPFVANSANWLWGADLGNMVNYFVKENAGFRHILVCTDIFSR